MMNGATWARAVPLLRSGNKPRSFVHRFAHVEKMTAFREAEQYPLSSPFGEEGYRHLMPAGRTARLQPNGRVRTEVQQGELGAYPQTPIYT